MENVLITPETAFSVGIYIWVDGMQMEDFGSCQREGKDCVFIVFLKKIFGWKSRLMSGFSGGEAIFFKTEEVHGKGMNDQSPRTHQAMLDRQPANGHQENQSWIQKRKKSRNDL